MRALRIAAQQGAEGLAYESAPRPVPGTGDVVVAVHAAGYTPGELEWPSTWVDRSGHDRTPIIPCHELSGVIADLGFGTTGFDVGDDVYGITDWYRDGAAAELVAVEARNLAPRPHNLSHMAASTLPLAGLTAHQALFRHGQLQPGQHVLILGAAGGVGNLAVQLAHHARARVTGAGRGRDRATIMEAGASSFLDLAHGSPSGAPEIDLMLDCIGGEVTQAVVTGIAGDARTVSIVDPAIAEMAGRRGTFFVVEPDRHTLRELTTMVEAGQLRPPVASSASLPDGRDLILQKETGGVPGKVSLQVC